MNPHEGHRERLREKIRKEGLAALAPHEVLEYFLFAFVPRRNTNEIAHELLMRFHSLSGVLEADYEALKTVTGMTDNAALFLSQLPALLVQYKMDKATHTLDFLRPDQAAYYLNELIGHLPTECFAALALDVKGNLLGTVRFESTRADAVSIDVRKLVKELLLLRAAGVILAHNHPSGDVSPSADDDRMYALLSSTLEPLGIRIIDCLIVGDGKAVSLVPPKAGLARAGAFAEGTEEGDWTPSEIGAGIPEEDEYNLLFNRNDKKK